jgi:hypothetical protein
MPTPPLERAPATSSAALRGPRRSPGPDDACGWRRVTCAPSIAARITDQRTHVPPFNGSATVERRRRRSRLAVARLRRAMGGEITVEDTLGGGLTVVVS